jgi:hypothetical protein
LPQCEREREAFDRAGTFDPLDRAPPGATVPLLDPAIVRRGLGLDCTPRRSGNAASATAHQLLEGLL